MIQWREQNPLRFPHKPSGPSLALDLDGTLCESAYPAFGKPRQEMVALARRLHDLGWWLIVASARHHDNYRAVRDWLADHEIPCDQLVLGAKPDATLFVDDKGLLPPPHALEALALLRAADDPWTAIAAGTLPCAWAQEQLAVPENPNAPKLPGDDLFRVVIPFSGGMDSTTLWGMAKANGLPYELVYVDVGQEYAEAELTAGADVTGDEPVQLLFHRLPATRWQHILPGRNATILFAIARWMRTRGYWGELWFGGLGGETPVVGGDKSARFLLTTQHLFTAEGLDVRLLSPLRTLGKPDLVAWWAARGQLDVLRQAKSCVHPTLCHCGRCHACFREAVAFLVRGAEPPVWEQTPDWEVHIDKYLPLMSRALATQDWSRYSPQRCRDTLVGISMLMERGEARPRPLPTVAPLCEGIV